MTYDPWHSIESVSKDETRILAWDGYEIVTLDFHNDCWGQVSDSGRLTQFFPTHWMHLPKPPDDNRL